MADKKERTVVSMQARPEEEAVVTAEVKRLGCPSVSAFLRMTLDHWFSTEVSCRPEYEQKLPFKQ